jgi:hypothetical protein
MWKMDDANRFFSHMRPLEARTEFERLGWDYDAYFKFAFVRNPWTRLASLYQMIHARGRGRLASLRKRLARVTRGHPSPAGFRRWVRTIQVEGSGGGGPENQRWQVYGTYTARAYLGDDEGNELVDRVIRLEDIDRELPGLLAKLGVPVEPRVAIPRVNVGGRGSYRLYYDPPTVELVARMYSEDIERFGYSFDR